MSSFGSSSMRALKSSSSMLTVSEETGSLFTGAALADVAAFFAGAAFVALAVDFLAGAAFTSFLSDSSSINAAKSASDKESS